MRAAEFPGNPFSGITPSCIRLQELPQFSSFPRPHRHELAALHAGEPKAPPQSDPHAIPVKDGSPVSHGQVPLFGNDQTVLRREDGASFEGV